MSHRITIKPSNRAFTADGGETILEAALREGFALPYGCRNGACGACKGAILEGSVDYGDYQASALGEHDKQMGKALFCCAKPLSDIVIEAKEVGVAKDIPIKTMPCRVQHIERPSDDVIVMYLKLPANERLQFLSGQYIDILLKDGKHRSFSLANAPHDDEFLQLHVRHLAGGQFTDYAFSAMKEKDVLRFEGPHGSFFLREDSDKPMVLLASGTGFAPIKAIVEHALHIGLKRTIILYWGARTRKDMYLPELPQKWQAEHDNFTFYPVLSEPAPSDDWSGRSGYVHEAVLDDFADLSGYQVYACGAPAMVEAAHHSFIGERGLPEDQFFSDAFFVAAATADKPN